MKTGPNIQTITRYEDTSKTWTYSDTRGPSSSKTSLIHREWQETKTGTFNPEWQDVIAAGGDASSAYVRTGIEIKQYASQPFTWFCTTHNPGEAKPDYVVIAKCSELLSPYEQIDTQNLNVVNSGPFSGSQALNQAVIQFYGDVARAVSPATGLVFLGELKDTLRMIHHPFEELFTTLRQYHKKAKGLRRIHGPKRALNAIRQSWLELQYGWKPLIRDINAGVSAFESFNTNLRSRCSGLGFDERVIARSHSEDLTFPYTGYPVGMTDVTTSDFHSVKIVGQVDWTAYFNDAPEKLDIVRAFGLTTREFLPSLWELIPYSFVIDSVVDIGGWLSAMMYANVKLRYADTMSKFGRKVNYKIMPQQRSTYKVLSSGVPPAWQSESTVGYQDFDIKYQRFSRTPGVQLSIPTPTVRMPGFQSWINYIALLPNIFH